MRCCQVSRLLGALAFSLVTRSVVATDQEPPARITVHNQDFVVTAPTEELAHTVLRKAEQLRTEISQQWFGQPIPAGVTDTIISVNVTERKDSGLTWPSSDPDTPSCLVFLDSSEENVTGALLAHEMTHVVFATKCSVKLPAWADEGIASLHDDHKRKTIRQRILNKYAAAGSWPAIHEILTTERIVSHDQAGYATASSLVSFLLTKGDHRTLLRFAAEGAGAGWDRAVNEHYQIADANGLQREWQIWVTKQLHQRQDVAAVAASFQR